MFEVKGHKDRRQRRRHWGVEVYLLVLKSDKNFSAVIVGTI